MSPIELQKERTIVLLTITFPESGKTPNMNCSHHK